ncbi:MAG TPA: NFACT family protein, partial [Candidatus Bipolaricaulis anaerobius]|nr:NFACT family protein [Candidatus Bipolaricaulis anaerobius]
MEGIELRKALEEARALEGARLAKVHQVGDVFFLRTYRPRGALALDPGGKAFHRTSLRPPTPPSPPPFCMLLRSLAGQPLLALDQAGLDRVVRLRFPEADLVLDLRPRQGDVFFLARDGRMASFRGGELRPVD